MIDRTVAQSLARTIRVHGPIPVSQYMAEANAHYYAARDPLGAAGDFVTAPEISQMFGELIGLCLADAWVRAGRPPARYVELGPGRGTLAADALRAIKAAGLVPPVEFVETSPLLRKVQAERIPEARWHDDVASLPDDMAMLVVANEFFDALPVRQLVRAADGWRERRVALDGNRFVPTAGLGMNAVPMPAHLREAPPGSILEVSPACSAIAAALAERLAIQGGVALVIDYGHERTGIGETLQAVSQHVYADPWSEPGTRDLTAHVDFEALGQAVRAHGMRTFGPAPQGAWLTALGVEARAEALASASPHRAGEIAAARHRLVADDGMGTLFKVLAFAAPDWPAPAGFT